MVENVWTFVTLDTFSIKQTTITSSVYVTLLLYYYKSGVGMFGHVEFKDFPYTI